MPVSSPATAPRTSNTAYLDSEGRAPAAQQELPRPRRSLASKTSWSAIATLTLSAAAAISTVLVARLLGPQGAGEVAYTIWLTTTAAVVVGLGLQQATIRYLAEQGAVAGSTQEDLARWLYRRGAASLLLGVPVLLLWLRFASRKPQGAGLSVAVVLLFAGQALGGLYVSTRTGLQDFRGVTRLNLVSAALQIGGVTAGAKLFGVTGALCGYTLGTLGPLAGGMALLWRRPKSPPEPLLRRRVLRYSLQTWAAAVVSLFAWSRLEVFFLDRSWGKQEVAMFTVALTLAQLATQGPSLLGTALYPHFSELAGGSRVEALGETYRMATRVLAFIAFPLCFGIAALSPTILPLVFGRAFAEAAPNAMVLLPFAAIGSVAAVGSTAVYAMERSRFIAISGIASAVFAVAAFLWAIPLWGAWGAVWARGVVQLLSVAMLFVYIGREMKMQVPLRELTRIAAASALSAGAAYLGTRMVAGRAQALAVGVVTMAACYLVASRVLGCLGEAELRRLDAVLASVPVCVGRPSRSLLAWIGARPVGP